MIVRLFVFFFFFQAEDGIRDRDVTGVQTCALPIFVDGLRAVAGEQPHGRLVGQFRGGDVGGGRDGEAGFLDGHVDEVGQSGPLARDEIGRASCRERVERTGGGGG